jgi:hypothetical protein
MTALAFIVASGIAAASSPDVTGNWQVNIDCGLSATASIVLNLADDSASGAIVGRYADCGTFEVPNAIRRVSSCVITPDPLPVAVSGSTFAVPASGVFHSDARILPLSLFSCSAATEIVSSHQLAGTITTDDTGRPPSVDGTFVNAAVDARDAEGVTCWSAADVPSCAFDMRRSELHVGDNVTVSPRKGATVTFEHVTAPGIVVVMPLTDADGNVPTHFEVLGTNGVPIFYDVRTTAQYEGTITSCFAYPDANGDGLVDGSNPLLDENDLRVLHEEHGIFVDRTVRLDTSAKMICAATTSLSELAIAHGPANGTMDHPMVTMDHPMVGGELVLKRKRSGKEFARFSGRLFYSSRPDPRQMGGAFDLFSASDDAVVHFPMPAEDWTATRNGRIFRFVNPSAPNTVSPVALAVLDFRRHRIKVVSDRVGLALDGAQHAVGVRVVLNATRNCFVYAGGAIRRDVTNHVVARGRTAPPLDCADKQMRWILARLTSAPGQ